MEASELMNILEAILFSSGEPVDEERLEKGLDVGRDDLDRAISELKKRYDNNYSGIMLIRMNERVQLVSRPDYSPYVRRVLEMGKPPSLSQAAMEVLAIVAYKQPVTRAYTEKIRGVDSSYTINSLLDKGMIESCGRLDVPGRPILYKTSEKFLRSFGLENLNQLPHVEGLDEIRPELDAFNDDKQ